MFNVYPIDRPLTPGRRIKIDHFIQAHPGRLDRDISSHWEDSGSVLILASHPVQWKLVFHPRRVEVFASAPIWVRMLFTEKRKAVAHQVILQMLEAADLFASPAPEDANTKAPAPASGAKAEKKSSSQ